MYEKWLKEIKDNTTNPLILEVLVEKRQGHGNIYKEKYLWTTDHEKSGVSVLNKWIVQEYIVTTSIIQTLQLLLTDTRSPISR